MTTHRGSCLCGGVRFEIDGPLMDPRITIAGSAPPPEGAWCTILYSGAGRRRLFPLARRRGACLVLRCDAGHASWLLHSERRIGAGEIRRTLVQRADRPCRAARYGVAPATLDDDPGARPDAHGFIVDKALWFMATDDLTQYPARIPGQNARTVGVPMDLRGRGRLPHERRQYRGTRCGSPF
jgi:hypothetical protein